MTPVVDCICGALVVVAIGSSNCACASETSPRPGGLLVYGADFVFAATEPQDWIGDTDNAATWNCNLLFYPKGENPRKATIIRVTVAPKSGDEVNQDLNADMEGYKRAYPEVQFKTIDVSHPEYRCFAKLYLSPGQFWEYVTYLDPGAKSRHLLSVAMNKRGSEASSAEMKAYRAAIRSIVLLSD